MTKLYNVRVYSIAVVAADNPEPAVGMARFHAKDVVSDDVAPHAAFLDELKSAADLIDGWDDRCSPYGSGKSIATILKEQPQ